MTNIRLPAHSLDNQKGSVSYLIVPGQEINLEDRPERLHLREGSCFIGVGECEEWRVCIYSSGIQSCLDLSVGINQVNNEAGGTKGLSIKLRVEYI